MRADADAVDRELRRRCERALCGAARAQGARTRQQARAAARGFVRRHRRDRGYLAFVLRGVLANSALAVALLSLASTPAQAVATVYTESTGSANPLSAHDTFASSAPAFGDLDADGDLDLISGEQYGSFLYYENTGSATLPAYVQRTGSANPLNGQNIGIRGTPALGDLDGDGDLDLISGEAYGSFFYFENTGSATLPAFVQRTGSANPLAGQDVGLESTAALGDLDGDGDLDLLAGQFYGVFNYYENTGTPNAPAFAARSGGDNPLNGQDAGLVSWPTIGDLDGDGDLDVVAGGSSNFFTYYENTGDTTHSAFVLAGLRTNPLFGHNVDSGSPRPVLADLDGDGDLDAVSGEIFGAFYYFENRAGDFPQISTGDANPAFGHDVGYLSAPALGDLDADGDLDLIAGEAFGSFAYLRNVWPSSPAFILQTGSANPLSGQNEGSDSVPALGDLDGDGDLDLVTGELDGVFTYYQNTGSTAVPAFVLRTGSADPLSGQDVGIDSAPALGDLDGDGDRDLVAGENGGGFFYFENTGSGASPAFVPRVGALNPLDGFDIGDDSHLALRDADRDGDLDAVAGSAAGTLVYFENTGSRTSPAFVQRTGGADPLLGANVGYNASPALGDLDFDGDIDLLSGESRGKFLFFENAIVRPSPRYDGPIAPPFEGIDVGSFSTLAAGDLDADGDPDFAASSGFATGAIRYFENTNGPIRPHMIERTGSANPFAALSAGFTPHLVFADLDTDGDLDLVSGDYGSVHYFENTGTATAAAYVERTGSANPLDAMTLDRSAPAFGDLDGDGDLDLVLGNAFGDFFVSENTGDAVNPAFPTFGAVLPFDGSFSTPALGDVDRDGDLDLLTGDEPSGAFYYFENTGSVIAPGFLQRTGAANPLDGEDVGLNSSPTFADLDGDGDLDVVAGERYGTLIPYYLPEPAAPLTLGSGAGLLAWLARWRRRARAR